MRVTFVSLDAYPLIDPTISAGIGGAEVRAMTFARGLQAAHGVNVDIVVRQRPGLPRVAAGFGIHGYTKTSVGALTKLGQSIAKRWTHHPTTNAFFHELDTDIVLCFGVRNDTASVIRSVRESGKRCVLFLTSDRNIEDARRQGRGDRGAYGELGHLCRFALQHADSVVVQTPYQQAALSELLGITGRLIRNPIDLAWQAKSLPDTKKPTILWIGRADTFSKRADLCIELAKRCANYHFKMIMNNHDPATFQQLVAMAPANVEIVEQVPYQQIEAHFRQATLLINTSAAEGFPNSFLQAAKYGKPIVSLDVDSGEMLSQFGCGICATGDLEHMANVVDSFVANRQFYDDTSKRAQEYVARFHEAGSRCKELHAVLQELTFHQKSVA